MMGAAFGAVAVAGCGNSGNGGPGASSSVSGRATDSGSSNTGPVTLEFWSWAAGMDVVVDTFNKSQSDITVKLSPSQSDQPGYQKLESAVKSDTGPDIAQVEYMMVPTMAISDSLQDVSQLAEQYKGTYPEAMWNRCGFLDQHYAIPNDSGPMVTYYNRDLLQAIGVEAPKTWDEYRESGEKLLKDKKAYIGTLLTKGPFLAALAAQNGAKWFDIKDDKWVVTINDDATMKALDFWFQMAKDGIVGVDPGFNAGFWASLDVATVASYTVGAWGYRGMKGNLKETAGKWHVAQSPRWNAGDDTNGSYGGSSWAVTKSCKHPEAALKFANWLASDAQAMNLQFENSGYYPAAGDTPSIKGYDDPDDFFGGDALGPVFNEAAKGLKSDWLWGPSMASVFTLLEDRINAAVASGSSADMLGQVQAETVKRLRDSGLEVSEG